jgi:hypothetical protein
VRLLTVVFFFTFTSFNLCCAQAKRHADQIAVGSIADHARFAMVSNLGSDLAAGGTKPGGRAPREQRTVPHNLEVGSLSAVSLLPL